MLKIPSLISLVRLPLAFLFLIDNVAIRCVALALAGLSDVLDGYIARKYNMQSKFGAALDPIMDKFFVVFILSVFIFEGKIGFGEAFSMLSRDMAVFAFGCYLVFSKQFARYAVRSIWCGKATTFLQFIVLLSLTLNAVLPFYVYGCFVLLGVLAFTELYLTKEIPA